MASLSTLRRRRNRVRDGLTWRASPATMRCGAGARHGRRDASNRPGIPGAGLSASGDGRGDLPLRRCRRREGRGDRLHLQSLPLCEGGDRPHGRRRAEARIRGRRLRGDLLQRRERLPRRFLRQHAGVRRAPSLRLPYLHDEAQAVARAYDAVCTPDFFGFDADRRLAYRGRLDEGRTAPPPKGARRELLEAMRAVARGESPHAEQIPSIGCSIKWNAG